MSNLDLKEILITTFSRLCQSKNNFNLGIGELLAALKLVEDGLVTDSKVELNEILQLLWCHSLGELEQFQTTWQQVIAEQPPKAFSGDTLAKQPEQLTNTLSEASVAQIAINSPSELAALPVRAPLTMPREDKRDEFESYWPISCRAMSYLWRYLRQPVADGAANVLDVKATVASIAHQGFYLAPVYRRQVRNNSHLILFLDQGGSMAPFHRFTRDIVKTAQDESALTAKEFYYFHNVMTGHIYQDTFLTEPVSFEEVLKQCSSESSVLIVSDAGAARGYTDSRRIRASAQIIYKLKQRTNLIAWLNPMPQERWPYTSAEVIANMVSMFQMDLDGFSRAIDVARGQPAEN